MALRRWENKWCLVVVSCCWCLVVCQLPAARGLSLDDKSLDDKKRLCGQKYRKSIQFVSLSYITPTCGSWKIQLVPLDKRQRSSLMTSCCLRGRAFPVVIFHGWAILEDAWQQVSRNFDFNKDRRFWNEKILFDTSALSFRALTYRLGSTSTLRSVIQLQATRSRA